MTKPLTDEERAELRGYADGATYLPTDVARYAVLRLLDERDALAAELARAHGRRGEVEVLCDDALRVAEEERDAANTATRERDEARALLREAFDSHMSAALDDDWRARVRAALGEEGER